MDHTLVDVEIENEAKQNALIVPFDPTRVRGASYDLGVGAKAVIATPSGLDWISLDEQKSLVLPPSRTCVVFSLEKVNMPADMKGRLSLRSHFAMQRLEYNGGIIDPGYRGYLIFTLANLGDAPVEIEYGERLVTVEFVRMDKSATRLYNDGKEILKLEDRQPPPKLPPLPKRQYDPIELSERVQKLDERILQMETTFEKFEPTLRVTEGLIEALILASVAGVIAGSVIVVFPLLPAPHNVALAVTVIVLFSIVLAARARRGLTR